MRHVDYIIIHCSAGFGNREAIERFWRNTLGWKSPGYHRLIDLDGTIHNLLPFSQVSNGVKGFNHNSINISYIGGVERTNVNIAKDTRTDAQKEAILTCIEEALLWCKQYQEVDDIIIQGHRDFSPDKNGNGVIEPWERIKECPSFNAIDEYWWIMGSKALNALSKKREQYYWLQKSKQLNK